MPWSGGQTSSRRARGGGQAGACFREDALRRGRRLLLTEAAFARVVGATLSGLFLTALVRELGGGAVHVGIALAAGALAGGAVAGVLEPVDLGVLAGIRIVPLHVLFAASTVLRLASLSLLRLIREPRRGLGPGPARK